MSLTIFPVTARFLIARAAKRQRTLMMRTHPEPNDVARSRADYGELRPSSRLPSCARDVELGSRICVTRIGIPMGSGICFSDSLKACSAERLAPMAQKVQVLLVDDLDGGEASETVSFSLDGTTYEIDLSSDNAGKLRKDFQSYIDHARKGGGGGRRRRARTGPGRERSAEIRAWARQRGHKVSERGRIPATIISEYEASH